MHAHAHNMEQKIIMKAFNFCVLVLVNVKVAHLQVPSGRSNIGSCGRLTADDIGRTDELSPGGLVALSLQDAEEDVGSVQVRIVDYNIVCEAAGLKRGTISSISVIVAYECSGGAGCVGTYRANRREQFQWDCVNDVLEESFSPPRRISFPGSIRTQNLNSTMDTPLNESCAQCADPADGIPTDANTHCYCKQTLP